MINMEIQKPYLLFLGDAHDILAAKVAIGIKQWHPEYWVKSDSVSQTIFRAFGDAVRAHALARTAIREAAE